jgi:hypothetical protein
VLVGAKSALNKCLSMFIEVEQYPYWNGQWLFWEVQRYLATHGLFPIARDFEYAHQFNVLFISQALLHQIDVRNALAEYHSKIGANRKSTYLNSAAVTRSAAGGTSPPQRDNRMNPVVYALALLTPFDINKPRVRIGPDRDGGYVVVKDFKLNQAVISYGIGTEYGFERELAHRGYDVYMFDHTIESINADSDRMKFYREGISGVSKPENNLYSIEDHLAKYDVEGDHLILKLDAEGAEIDAIGMASETCLRRFEQIVLEIHGLVNLGRDDYRDSFVAMFSKLNKLFTLFHVHANNHDGPNAIYTVSGCPVSNLLELSYVRTASIERYASRTLYPTPFGLHPVPQTPS